MPNCTTLSSRFRAIGSDTAIGRAGGAKEHSVAQIGGYLNPLRGEFELPIERGVSYFFD